MLHVLFFPFHAGTSIVLAPAVIGLLVLGLRQQQVVVWLRQHRGKVRAAVVAACLLCLLFFFWGGAALILQHRLTSDDEGSVLSIAAAYLHGQPMYPGTAASAEYGLLYGPVTFLLYTPPMLLHAFNGQWFQVWVGLALLLSLALIAFALLRRHSVSVAAILTAYCGMVLAQRTLNAWSLKADPWIILFSALGFAAAAWLPVFWADLVIAVAGGALIDLKVTLFALALLPLAALSLRTGQSVLRRLPSLLVMGALACAIFLLPHISLSGYRDELSLASHHGISRRLLVLNVTLFLQVAALPFLGALWASWRMEREATRLLLRRYASFGLLLSVASFAALLGGSKNGAGPWHLLPLAVPFAWLDAELLAIAFARLRSHTRYASLAPALWFLTALFVHGMYSVHEAVQGREDDKPPYSFAAVQRDLLDVRAKHPAERMQLGAGSDSAPDFELLRMRYLLTEAGEPLFSDPNTRNERDAARSPYSSAFTQAFSRCTISLWLIPKGAVPFSMHAPYSKDRLASAGLLADSHLYPAPLPQAFLHAYAHTGQSQFFDLWTCKGAQANQPSL